MSKKLENQKFFTEKLLLINNEYMTIKQLIDAIYLAQNLNFLTFDTLG
jgi:hypothetical protein